MKKAWTVLFALCLCAALLAGCGGSGSSAPAAAEVPAGEELVEYVIENVGTLYLPEGFEVDSFYLENPLPHYEADLNKGDVNIHVSWMGPAAYEAAGVPLPADVEEYSHRDGVTRNLPEGKEYARDEQNNMAVSFIRDDGMFVYDVLLQGTDAFGNLHLVCPEGDPAIESFPVWATKAKLN